MLLDRIVIFNDVTRSQGFHLRLPRLGFVASVVFRIAVEPILNQHADREKKHRCGKEDPVAAVSQEARHHEYECEQRQEHEEIANRADHGRFITAQQRRTMNAPIARNLKDEDEQDDEQM